jgi:hypothetical protein
MAAANIAIDAVCQSGSIPHEIALDQLLSADELNELAGFFKVDRQGGQLSRLHITSSPTLTGAIDGSPNRWMPSAKRWAARSGTVFPFTTPLLMEVGSTKQRLKLACLHGNAWVAGEFRT